MSKIGDIRRAVEALPRYDAYDGALEEFKHGDWLRRSDVMALFPPAPQIIYHGGERNPYGYGHPKIMPKMA